MIFAITCTQWGGNTPFSGAENSHFYMTSRAMQETTQSGQEAEL